MSETLGPISYSENEDTVFLGREITRTRTHSEAIALKIDQEVRSILMGAKSRAEDLLTGHRGQLEKVAEALVKHEVLQGEDVERILAGEELVKDRPAETDEGAEDPQPAEPSEKPACEADPGPQPPPRPATQAEA